MSCFDSLSKFFDQDIKLCPDCKQPLLRRKRICSKNHVYDCTNPKCKVITVTLNFGKRGFPQKPFSVRIKRSSLN